MTISLPIEVQNRIFRLAVPIPSRYSTKERNTILCRLALVSKYWRRLAQAELVAQLDVQQPGKPLLNRLMAKKDRITPDALDPQQARSIAFRRSGDIGREAITEVERLLELCSNVEEIWLASAKKAPSRDIRMFSLVKELPGVHTLHFQLITFSLHDQHILTHVRTLSLRAGGERSWALLTPEHLPQLTSLNLLLETPKDEHQDSLIDYLVQFGPLKPQLETLSVTSNEEPSLAGRLNSLLEGCIHLQHFYLNTTAAVDLHSALSGLSALDNLLETLQVSFAVANLEQFAESLDYAGDGLGLRSLKRLVVPGGGAVKGWEGWSEEENGAREKLEQWCAARETQLVTRPGYESAEDWRA